MLLVKLWLHANKLVLFSVSLCSTVCALSQRGAELCELSQLAWKGLQGSQILFLEEDISQDVLEFSTRTGLFTRVSHGYTWYICGCAGLPLTPTYNIWKHLALSSFIFSRASRIGPRGWINDDILKSYQWFNIFTSLLAHPHTKKLGNTAIDISYHFHAHNDMINPLANITLTFWQA